MLPSNCVSLPLISKGLLAWSVIDSWSWNRVMCGYSKSGPSEIDFVFPLFSCSIIRIRDQMRPLNFLRLLGCCECLDENSLIWKRITAEHTLVLLCSAAVAASAGVAFAFCCFCYCYFLCFCLSYSCKAWGLGVAPLSYWAGGRSGGRGVVDGS